MTTPPREQYFRFPRQLLESPAWRVLNIHERRAFDCIMGEHQRKSGYVNGGLAVTKRDFERYGVHPKHVAGVLRVLDVLGIVKRTRNMGGSRNGRSPNLYRPTFLRTTPEANDATHDYLEIQTVEEAERRAELHRYHEKRTNRMPLPKTRKLTGTARPKPKASTGNPRADQKPAVPWVGMRTLLQIDLSQAVGLTAGSVAKKRLQ